MRAYNTFHTLVVAWYQIISDIILLMTRYEFIYHMI